jgi:hypothetical protein
MTGCSSRPRRAAAETPAHPMVEPTPFADPAGWSLVWTHGEGCPDLASLLGGTNARRAGPDLRASCIEARADLLVCRRFTSFDLVPVAVPYDFDPDKVGAIVGAVAGGPHSLLAARIARRLGQTLGVPASLVAASPDPADDPAAETVLERAAAEAPGLSPRVVRATDPAEAARSLPAGTLLVLGAPGGTWWQRQVSGPGRRLRLGAPAGAVVVRSAPRRCFHEMDEPAAMGMEMPAEEALRVSDDAALPVANGGRLVGMVRRRALEGAPPSATLGTLMEEPVCARVDDPLDTLGDLAASLDGAPLPVVDSHGRLCGLLSPSGPTR